MKSETVYQKSFIQLTIFPLPKIHETTFIVYLLVEIIVITLSEITMDEMLEKKKMYFIFLLSVTPSVMFKTQMVFSPIQ